MKSAIATLATVLALVACGPQNASDTRSVGNGSTAAPSVAQGSPNAAPFLRCVSKNATTTYGYEVEIRKEQHFLGQPDLAGSGEQPPTYAVKVYKTALEPHAPFTIQASGKDRTSPVFMLDLSFHGDYEGDVLSVAFNHEQGGPDTIEGAMSLKGEWITLICTL